MSFNNVLETSIDERFGEALNNEAKLALILEAAQRAKANDDRIETETKVELKRVGDLAAEAKRLAETLGGFEEGQIEKMFADFLKVSGVEQILAQMGVPLDGKVYSLTSVLNQLIQRGQTHKEEIEYNAAGYPVTNKVTLQDGYSFLMRYVIEEVISSDTGLPTGDKRLTGTGEVRGIPVTEMSVRRPIKTTVTLFGQPYDTVSRFELVTRTRIMYDITPLLVAATVINSGVPDFNGDGVIGNPESEVPTEAPTETPVETTPTESDPQVIESAETPAETPTETTPAERTEASDESTESSDSTQSSESGATETATSASAELPPAEPVDSGNPFNS
jgi:hypothetical protein